MSFENLIKIIGGILLNTPSIGKFESLESDPKKTKLGDLFIALDPSDIEEALKNGAYGVLCDYDTPIIDEEIAWIRVDNIEYSLKKLLRFKLLKKDLDFFYLSHVEFEIAKSITKTKDLIFLKDDMIENFKKIINADENSIIISSDEKTLKDIYPNFKTHNNKELDQIKLTYKTLFCTSLIYDDIYYENLKFPSLFIDELNNILDFLKTHDISYDLNSIELKNHFKPIFITDKFKIKHFGESEHVIIIESSQTLISSQLTFIKEFATWANATETSLEELPYLDIDKFNFILIQANYNELIKFLEKFSIKNNNSLFTEL